MDNTSLFNNDYRQLSRDELINKMENAPKEDEQINKAIMRNTIDLKNHTIKKNKFENLNTLIMM